MGNVGKYTIHRCYVNGKTTFCQKFLTSGDFVPFRLGGGSMFFLHLGGALEFFFHTQTSLRMIPIWVY